jgi:alcohol dehydrogenase
MKALVYHGPGKKKLEDVAKPLLLKRVMAGKLKPKQLVTHHYTLDDIIKAYDTFGHSGREHALKVILTSK